MPERTARSSRADDLAALVGTRIDSLQARFLHEDPRARAQLAQLRQSVGQPAGSVPAVWELTVAGVEPADRWGDEPTDAETVARVVMGLYALHQRAKHNDRMHHHAEAKRVDLRLGGAVARLRTKEPTPGKDRDEALVRRFTMLVTALSWDETVYHLRGLVGLLAAENLPLDYGQLARDLYQIRSQGASSHVYLAWARGFHRLLPATSPDGTDVIEEGTPS